MSVGRPSDNYSSALHVRVCNLALHMRACSSALHMRVAQPSTC